MWQNASRTKRSPALPLPGVLPRAGSSHCRKLGARRDEIPDSSRARSVAQHLTRLDLLNLVEKPSARRERARCGPFEFEQLVCAVSRCVVIRIGKLRAHEVDKGHSVARHHRSVPVPHLPWTGHEQRASLRLEYFVSAFREGRERVPKRPTPLLRRTLAAIEPASAVAAPALDPMRAAPCHEDGSDRPAPAGQGGPVCNVRSWGPPHAEINGRRQTPVAVARRPNGPTAVHRSAADRALKWRAQLLARSLLFRAAAVSVSKFNC